MDLKQLSAKLDSLLQFDESGRGKNPLYDPRATNDGIRRLNGKGRHMRVPLDRVVSTQATVHTQKVKDMAGKLRNGVKGKPTANLRGGMFVLTDGNHRAAAHKIAGRKTIKILVQR